MPVTDNHCTYHNAENFAMRWAAIEVLAKHTVVREILWSQIDKRIAIICQWSKEYYVMR